MTLHDWFWILFTVVGGVFTLLVYLRNELKSANEKAAAKVENEKTALGIKLDLIQTDIKTSLYNAKKDVLDKLREEKDILHERCERIEGDHAKERNAFTTELRSIVETFTRTCDGIQSKLEHLTSTIIGQYVPRSEIDNRFARIDEKQDRVLSILYDMKQ